MALDVAEESPVGPQLENDAMWQMNHRANGSMEGGPYPERRGEQDCAYYLKTGVCRFGMTCRYNHPPNKKLAISSARLMGSYPERVGEPECQYYLKTGTCKFGSACKFDHPRDKAGIDGTVSLNILGYPLRTNEQECSYYLRTGLCKFGSTCKFHHPQPSNSMPTLANSPVYYSSVNSSTNSGQQSSYLGGDTNYGLSRASFPPNPRWQGLSSYAQLLLPQGVVSVPSWNAAYAGQLGSFSTSENQQQTSGPGMFGWQKDNNIFPERPDQPECQFYMKTGDCKFGAVCKFHHPKDRLIPVPNCLLSPLGLPLRPGEPSCSFYSRYGICKFGPNCKFDHPMGTFTYGLSLSALSDVPIVRRMLGSLPGTAAPPMSISGGKFMRLTPQISSRDEETFDGENSH